jgi:hypothetical protein
LDATTPSFCGICVWLGGARIFIKLGPPDYLATSNALDTSIEE